MRSFIRTRRLALAVLALTGLAVLGVQSIRDIIGQPGGRAAALYRDGVYRVPRGQVARSAEISPDGNLLLISALKVGGKSPGYLYCWDLSSDRLVHSLTLPSVATAVGFTPDGKRLIVATSDGDLCVYDLQTWGKVDTFSNDPPGATARDLHVTTDGKRVVVNNVNLRGPRVWDLSTKQLTKLPAEPVGYGHTALSPDSKLLTVPAAKRIDIIDIATAKTVKSLSAGDGAYTCAQYLPPGKLIAAALFHSGNKYRIDLWDPTLSEPVVKRDINVLHPPQRLSASPDGRYFLTFLPADMGLDPNMHGPGELLVWSIPDGKLVERIQTPSGGGSQFALSPDATRLVTVGDDGTILKWDFAAVRRAFESRP
jgi:WD40 repeat protein